MELDDIVSLMERSLETSLEAGIRAVRQGDVEGGLSLLEQANAELATAISTLRSVPAPFSPR